MNINIPDKIPKLFVLIGLILIAFGYYNKDIANNEYYNKVDKFNTAVGALELEQMRVDNELTELKRISENLSIKFGIENPISIKDSLTTSFKQILSGNKKAVAVSDSINKLWERQSAHSFNLKLLDKKIKLERSKIDQDENLHNNYHNAQLFVIIIGMFFFFIGLITWLIDEQTNPVIKLSEKLHERCQSCGKVFTAVRQYGLEKDLTPNYAFCEECYNNGNFTNPELSESEIINFSMGTVKAKNWLYKRFLKARLKELERWNPHKY
jgi:hypothetical protein